MKQLWNRPAEKAEMRIIYEERNLIRRLFRLYKVITCGPHGEDRAVDERSELATLIFYLHRACSTR